MEPIQALQTSEVWMLLAFLLVCAFIPMLVMSRTVTTLIPEGHMQTRWIDGLRGLAAAIVSLNHAPYVIGNLAVIPKAFYVSPNDDRFLLMSGALGVQMFFCITGLLFAGKILSEKPVDWSDFYAKRVRRVVPAYLAAVLLAIVIAAWFSWPITQSPKEMLAATPNLFSFGLLYMPTINGFNFSRLLGVTWTLAIEWRFYFVLPLIYLAVKKSRKVTFTAIIAFAITDLAVSGVSSWSFFIPGALCSLIAGKNFGRNVRIIAGVVALAAVVFIYYRSGQKTNYGLEQWLCVSALFTALTISRPSILNLKVFVGMGTVSYSFYLLHSMLLFAVLGAVNFYVVDLGTLSIAKYAMLAGGTLALATIVSTASYLLIEDRYMHKPSKSKVAATRYSVAAK
ncbi:acyltransferase [Pseudomonas fluorescens]|uniref:acyltransferase family protein n=1 Tax=Pseudomonas fluorescens TaxID=294 RepID=UPI0021D2F65E|nr:acyltransferase [Pseudomonas fluorescens]UXV21079.1 acyltransferase [Pseudomonas fluorescens]